LTGKPYSAKLAPDAALIQSLRHKHGQELEKWWRQNFGFGFDELTRSEARYLENSADAQPSEIALLQQDLKAALRTPVVRPRR
jgi:hypothetical protein